LFSEVIELEEGLFCPDVLNDDHLNVSALLSNLLSKNGNEGASDQAFMVLRFGDFALIAKLFGIGWGELNPTIHPFWATLGRRV